jgi:hypothetical protein
VPPADVEECVKPEEDHKGMELGCIDLFWGCLFHAVLVAAACVVWNIYGFVAGVLVWIGTLTLTVVLVSLLRRKYSRDDASGLAREMEDPAMGDAAMDLIRDYLAAVADAVARVQQHVGADLVRQGPGGGRFPRFGVLPDGSEYQFHGYGCSVGDGDLDINFDFASDGRFDVFDAWRLWYFAKQQPERYAFKDLESIKDAIQTLTSQGRVTGLKEANRGMLFLTGSTPQYL